MRSSGARNVARSAENSGAFRFLARGGFAVNGVMHILIGVIAIRIATGTGGGSADQSGAFAQLAAAPGGVFLLWIVVVGMFALGLWYVLEGLLTRGPKPNRAWLHKLTSIAKGVVYLVLGYTAFTFANGGSTSSAGTSQSFSAKVLAAPGGVFVVALVGLIVFAVGGYFVVKGSRRKFLLDLRLPSGRGGRAITFLGATGYVAKGLALGIVGVLFVDGALTHKASDTRGLDGALRALTALPYGGFILVVVGLGVIAYGLYCFVRSARSTI